MPNTLRARLPLPALAQSPPGGIGGLGIGITMLWLTALLGEPGDDPCVLFAVAAGLLIALCVAGVVAAVDNWRRFQYVWPLSCWLVLALEAIIGFIVLSAVTQGVYAN